MRYASVILQRRTALNLAAMLLCALILVNDLVRLQRLIEVTQPWEQLHIDFVIFFDSAEQVRRGLSLYTPVHTFRSHDGTYDYVLNLNHPALTLLFLPLTWLPQVSAYVVWSVASILAFLIAVLLGLREARTSPNQWYLPSLVAMTIAFPGMIQSVSLGQVGLILSPLVVVAWILLRRNHEVTAGLLVGVLIACKPFLLPLAAYFVALKQWRGMPAVGVGGVLLSLVALPYTGVAGYEAWFTALSATPYQNAAFFRDPWNISLVGMLARFGVAVSPLGMAALLIAATSAGFWLMTWPAPAGLQATDRRFATLLTIAFLCSPVGWTHYLPLLLPVFIVAFLSLVALLPWQRAVALAGLALIWLSTLRLAAYVFIPPERWVITGLTALPTIGVACLALVLASSLARNRNVDLDVPSPRERRVLHYT